MLNKIEKAKSILIVPDDRHDIDLVTAVFAIAESLILKSKKVSILKRNRFYEQEITKIIPAGSLKFINQNKPKDFVVSIESKDATVKEVNWEQKDGVINIVITTEDGKINTSNTKVLQTTFDYDIIVFVGFAEKKSLDKFYENNQDLFLPTKIIVLDNKKSSQDQNYDQYISTNSSLSEIAYKFLRENQLEIIPNIADNIISGIYWYTNQFRDNIKNGFFIVINELTESGANISKATNRVTKTLKLIETRLIMDVIKNIKITKDKIAVSKTGTEATTNIKLSRILYKNWNLTEYMLDIRGSIIFVPFNNKHLVVVSTSDPKLNAFEACKKYNSKGNKNRAEFVTEMDIDEIENDLLLKFALDSTDQIETDRLTNKIQNQSKELPEGETPKAEGKMSTTTLPANQREVQPEKIENRPINIENSQLSTKNDDPYDPLKPADKMPVPIKIEEVVQNAQKAPTVNSPLPQVGQ